MDTPSPRGGMERTLFRPSRTSYPGSKFGPKTRYDLPQRRKAYGNADDAEAILFNGTSLQPQTWPQGGASVPRNCCTTPRSMGVLGDVARSMLHPLSDRNLPELPLIDERNDVHGVLMLGGAGCGKTSLVLSLVAAISGSYPSRYDKEIEEKKGTMPTYGQCYELPDREVTLGSGAVKPMRLVLTDTPACGTSQGEQPLCAAVSPNSSAHFNAIPSWMRITLRGGSYPHYAVLVVVDALAPPLWEDHKRCRDMARLLAVLKRSQYTVVIGVTKLFRARRAAARDVAHGAEHGGQVGRDPRSSYEAFVDRYLNKVCASIQSKAAENEWSFSQGPDSPEFPRVNATIFDAPSWVSVGDFKEWNEKKGTLEQPNLKYMTSQLDRLLGALAVRSHPEG